MLKTKGFSPWSGASGRSVSLFNGGRSFNWLPCGRLLFAESIAGVVQKIESQDGLMKKEELQKIIGSNPTFTKSPLL